MGKRGKGPPVKLNKPNGNNNTRSNWKEKEQRKPVIKSKSSSNAQRDSLDDSGIDIKLKASTIINVKIDNKCRLLAEEALLKTTVKKVIKRKISTASTESTTPPITPAKRELRRRTVKTSDAVIPVVNGHSAKTETKPIPVREPVVRKSPQRPAGYRELKSLISKPDQAASRTSKCRRKALTRAIKRLRTTSRPVKKTKKSQVPLRQSSTIKQSLRNSPSRKVLEKKKESVSNSRNYNLRASRSKMDYDVKDNDLERESSSSVASNNRSPSSESESEDSGSDSDSEELEMQVLEKQVESEKEEEDDEPAEITLMLPDTDEESSLLSPSALPASELFRSPSSKKKTQKSDGGKSEKSRKEELSKTSFASASPPYFSRTSPLPSTSSYHRISPLSPSSFGYLGSLPGKRGRGRPRKALEDVKSVSGKLYRKKLGERKKSVGMTDDARYEDEYLYSNYDLHSPDHNTPVTYSSSTAIYQNFSSETAGGYPLDYYSDDMGPNETDPENVQPRLDRWKDRSTFVYAKHKFVSNENKFKCDTCQVSFTALSSLKRHYGTIYHKQQEAAGRSTLDLSDILRPDRDGSITEGHSSRPSSSSSFYPSNSSNRGRGRGRPPLARTTSVVRRNAVDNIKKYYAAADAARRRRENHSTSTTTTSKGTNFTSTWLQKQQRKRKPLLHSDYLYPSASADSEADDADDDDDFGCEEDEEENNENSWPINGNDYDNGSNDAGEDTVSQTPWLSNVWKGFGVPHFTCEVCNIKYTKKFEFTAHLFEHRQEEARRLALTCPDCQGVFPNESLLEHHFGLFNHGIGMIRDGRPSKDILKFSCSKCNSKFTRRDYYRKHLDVHKRPLLSCPHCPKKFLYKFYLSDHIKGKHDGWNNNLANNVNATNNGNSVGGPLPAGSTTPGANPTAVYPSNATNNIPKPKVELYSNSTTLFPTTDISKRKNSNFSGGSCEAYDAGNLDGGKKKSASAKNASSSSAVASREIVVPKFITCDPFAEKDSSSVGTSVSTREANSNKSGYERFSVSDALSPASSSGDKDRVNLLQKFFDSQKELSHQDDPTKAEDNETVNPLKQVRLDGISSIDHSTTEDGKIVFQLEHSMFKGFGPLEGEAGDVNTCSLSPLTIEIPRANINIGADEDAESEHEQPVGSNSGNQRENLSKVNPEIKDTSVAASKMASVTPTSGKADKGVSTTPSSSGLMGCGVKMNLSITPQPDNELQCQDCGKLFEHKKSLIKHVRYYSQGESYPCTLCDKSFKLKHHVSRHIKSFHNIDTSSTTSSASDDLGLEETGDTEEKDVLTSSSGSARGGTLLSSSGLLTIPSSASTHTSEGSKTSRKEFTASASPTKRSLSIFSEKSTPVGGSSERKRSASESSSKKGETDPTTSSSISFSKANYIILTDSSGVQVFKCLICKKLYPSKNQIRSHLSYHKRTIPYKCPLCNTEFKFKHDMNTHLQAHHTDRPKFHCDKCPEGKSFLSKKDLMKHQREKHHHLGRKPSGQDHSGGHSQVAISICPLCPLVFPQESDLQKHISKEHNKKESLVCSICGLAYKTAELLQRHKLQEHLIVDKDNTSKSTEAETFEDLAPTHSPLTSPAHVSQDAQEPKEELEEGPMEELPSSPEFELLEIN